MNKQFDPLSAGLTECIQAWHTDCRAGYQAALDALNQKKTAATSTVRNLGTGILATDRKSLNDYISGARSDVNSHEPRHHLRSQHVCHCCSRQGTDVHLVTSVVHYAVQLVIRSSLHLSDLINAGGAVQGAKNPTAANPIAGAGYVPPPDDSNTKRGLGSTGAF